MTKLDEVADAMQTYRVDRICGSWEIWKRGERDATIRGLTEAQTRAECARLNALEVLKAIREPNLKMLKAGDTEYERPLPRAGVIEIWHVMIDALLKS